MSESHHPTIVSEPIIIDGVKWVVTIDSKFGVQWRCIEPVFSRVPHDLVYDDGQRIRLEHDGDQWRATLVIDDDEE